MLSPFARRVALVAVALAVVVVALGAYVRLSHAGLGCPDWPVCYGKLTWPKAGADVDLANAAFPERPVDTPKAAKEQIHRIVAGSLGLLVLTLAFVTAPSRRARGLIAGASIAAALGIATYANGLFMVAGLLSVLAVVLPLICAGLMRADMDARIAMGLLGLIIFQAMLGMWTVTLLLKPIVVTAHLLGGLATLALLVWLAARQFRPAPPRISRAPILVGLAVLLVQIFLGGWTSTNYAALACPDFPTCQGELLPQLNVKEAFVLWRGIGVDYEGGVLDSTARATIHVFHRWSAVIVALVLGWLAVRLWRADNVSRRFGAGLLILLAVQIGLGIYNVVGGLPLANAVAHNVTAALLLCWFVLLLTWRRPADA